jgi:hypothetical protein
MKTLLHRVTEGRNILHTVKRRKANWVGHILPRNDLLKYVIEGKIEIRIEVKGIRRRRRKQLLDDLKEKTEYCKLKEDLLACALQRILLESGYGPVVR